MNLNRFKKRTLAAAIPTLLFSSGIVQNANAANQPSSGTAVIDGSYAEWDLSNDFFAKMCEAGAVDQSTGECNNKDHLSNLYLRYDCFTNTMFALVLSEGSHWPSKTAQNAWIKVPAIKNSPMVDGTDDYNNGGTPTGNPSEFSWVVPNGKEEIDLIGYESSFKIVPSSYKMQAHINIIPGRTSSTGKSGNEVEVKLYCDIEPKPSLNIETWTNNLDADNPTGPLIPVGNGVTWTYWVKNTGNVPLDNVVITDTGNFTPNLISGDINYDGKLDLDEIWMYQYSGTAEAGQYQNLGTATGQYNTETVTDSDPSHYYGENIGEPPVPSIDIETLINGYDADNATGPKVLVDTGVVWTYVVTNTGNVALTNVIISSDNPSVVDCGTFNGTLEPNQVVNCTASGTAQAGQFANMGTVIANYNEFSVNDTDPSHYFGANPVVDIETHTQGFDADSVTGPFVEQNDPVYWLYSVKNTGNVPLTNINVTDDKLYAADINCGGDDNDNNNIIEMLAVGQTLNCTANGIAAPDQYKNTGTATTTYVDDFNNNKSLNDVDLSHYFGVVPGIGIEVTTNNEDVDNAPGIFVIQGDTISWSYVVTNTGNVALSNVNISDNQGVVIDCGDKTLPLNTLALDESVTCTATGTAILGQYTNEGLSSGEYTVYLPDGTPETRTTKDMDPSNYYAFISNQPSLEVSGLSFEVTGNSNEYINGVFTAENASDGPEVQAIGIIAIDMVIDYRLSGGGQWHFVNETCTFDPTLPFVFEGPTGTQKVVKFRCTAEASQIPPDATAVRVSSEVNIFNRGKTFKYRESSL